MAGLAAATGTASASPGAGAGPVPATAAPASVTPEIDEVEAAPPTQEEQVPEQVGPAFLETDVVVASGDVSGYATVGVTWSGPTDPSGVTVSARTATSDGVWDEWTPLEIEPGPEGGVTGGTAPLVIGDVAQVEVAVQGAAAAGISDVQLAIVDPGTHARDSATGVMPTTAGTSPAGRSAGALTAVPTIGAVVPAAPAHQFSGGPVVLSRGDWGADESLASWRPTQGDFKAAVIHHTAGTNDYDAAQVPSILRGIYAYHAQTRGWGDIGYNFLVDKFGRIWEGRHGGVEMETVGAHVSGWNTNTVGVSVLGNYETATVSDAAVDAIVRLLGWKMSLQGIRAGGTTNLNGRTISTIVGHRDLASTSCPGASLYSRIGEIRTRVAAEQGRYAHLFDRGTTFLVQGAGRPEVYLMNGTYKSHIQTHNTLTSLSALGNLLYADLRYTNMFPNGPALRRFVRDDRSGRISFVDNNRLYHAASCNDVAAFGTPCDFRQIPTLAPVEWDRLGQGGTLGRAVRVAGTDPVFWVEDGRKRWIRTYSALVRVAGSNPQVVDLSRGALEDVPTGADLY